MKKILISIVLCFVCTLCFGKESVYIRTTDCCINDILLNQWASKQPYNSLASKNFFLAEIERRKND